MYTQSVYNSLERYPMAKASTKTSRPTRRESIVNLRMPTPVKDLIDTAAEALGKTRTAFIIESSRAHAENVLLDKRLFALGSAQSLSFMAALDEAPQPNAKLKRLFARKAVWDK